MILLSCSAGILGVHVIHGVYRQHGRISFKENVTETVDLRLKGQEKSHCVVKLNHCRH